ncbi:MAG TPA: glycosyltransferase, partial [Bacteroidales bacterium]|nr:glycosyltransferase [Bacteroidales bacterium]
MSDGLVIIPTYNEKENIRKVLKRVFELPEAFDVLIVDDNSPDGTANIVKSLMDDFNKRLFLLEREGKLGLGTAYIKGFRWALDHGYDYIFEMDADLSHNPDDLVRLYRTAKEEGQDLVIGSRYVKGVNVVNWPMGRVLMSYFASIYVKIILGIKIDDTTA